MSIPPNQYAFTDEFWREQPRFTLPDDHMETCELHGEFNPHDWYTPVEISRDLAQMGHVDCPWCLVEIVGVAG
jgi:hypothetical protein